MEYESLKWSAPEFEHREKNSDWYWILGVIAVFGALISIVLHNTLFAILIIIGAFIMALFGSKHPDVIEYEINKRGIRVNDKLHTFNSIDTFWIDETNENFPKLLLTLVKTLSFQIVIPIHPDSVDEIHEHLIDEIHEEEQSESFAERIMEAIGF